METTRNRLRVLAAVLQAAATQLRRPDLSGAERVSAIEMVDSVAEQLDVVGLGAAPDPAGSPRG